MHTANSARRRIVKQRTITWVRKFVLKNKLSRSDPTRAETIRVHVERAHRSTRRMVREIDANGSEIPHASGSSRRYKTELSRYKAFRRAIFSEFNLDFKLESDSSFRNAVIKRGEELFPKHGPALSELLFEELRQRAFLKHGRYIVDSRAGGVVLTRNIYIVHSALKKLGVSQDKLPVVTKELWSALSEQLPKYNPFENTLRSYIAKLVQKNYRQHMGW